MNRKQRLFWVAIVSVMMLTPLAQADDLAEGFSGIQWGRDITNDNYLSKLYQKEAIVYYINPGQIHTIFDINVPDVVYGAYSGQFFSVFMSIETMSIFMELKKQLKQKYGLPDVKTSTKYEETVYKWKHNDIKIKLKVSEKKNRLKLAFYYTPISNQVNESQMEDIQEARLRVLPIDRDKKPEYFPLLIF
jgi:hypothetical protein